MTDFHLVTRIKVVTGVRFEKSAQNLDSYSITNEPIHMSHSYDDWLPSLNMTYAPQDKINVRAAFAKTLARPEFRELAPFSYFDFLANELVQGNMDLKRSLITNADIRLEYYPKPGELLAISGFHKKFSDPIEQILIAASGFEPIRSYENADEAMNYGIELEVKKGLNFISAYLAPLSFIGNVSWIQSEINLKGENAFQKDKRPLQGQADYISNAGLYYENRSGKFSRSLIFNRVGESISRVGFANLGDIVELPRNQIDFTFSARLIEHLSMKLAAKDLLNQDHEFVQRTLEGDKRAELRTTGRTVALGITYQL
jgi:TonB-dependent receptor